MMNHKSLKRWLHIKSPVEIEKDVLRESPVKEAMVRVRWGERVLNELEAIENREAIKERKERRTEP